MSTEMDTTKACRFCGMDDQIGSACRCVCADEYDTVNIDRQRYVLFSRPGDWNSFTLIPIKQFLADRGDPMDYCFNCHCIKLNCNCGKKNIFRPEQPNYTIVDKTDFSYPLPQYSPISSDDEGYKSQSF
jgi:hypothetical protein